MPDVGVTDGLVNLAHMIDEHDGGRVALVAGDVETTYAELRDQVGRARGRLAARGVSEGDRVVILCGNTTQFVVAALATVGLGAIAVPLNPDSPVPELEREIDEVTPVAAILGPTAAAVWSESATDRLASVATVIVPGEGSVPGAISFESLLSAEPVPARDVEPDHLAVMMFTSGTAGPPRPAMISHGNLLSNIEQSLTARDRTNTDDLVYGVLPLFHIFGLAVVLGTTLTVGAGVLLVQRFDPVAAAETIARRRVTVVPGAPTMWVAFAESEAIADDAFASVRLALSGAAKLPPAVAERVEQRFGVVIREGYGLTEASPVVTSSAGMPVRIGSVGRVLVGQEVRLVDEDGEDVPAGDAGEIWVRGPNVFQGYWNDAEATARVLRDGWLRTGDVATVDEDGYLYLVDRAKDLIIVSGFNVFPAEVEEVISNHPSVAEVGVVGVPHAQQGEAVKAYVVRLPGAELDAASVIEYSSDFLARYKCPTSVAFVDRLPRNASGKLIRRELEGTVIA
jgi:long-chain acyl-CoA synthetase